MNVPKLRFKEFDGEWEEQKLGDITEKIGSGKTPKGGKATYQTEGIALIRSQNIFNDQVNSNDIAYISTETDESMKNSRVFNGDILLNITGASIGRSAVYKKDVIANVNQHVCIIRPKKDYSSVFIQLNISSNKGQKEIEFNQAGGGREGLNFQQIAKMKFNYPSIKEQNKISLLFEKLNKKIQLQQQKIDLLQEQKKGYQFKLLNNPDWKEIRLGDYAEIRGRLGWKGLKQEEYVEKGAYLIAGKHITRGNIFWDKCDQITIERYEESIEIALKENDIIFSKDGSLGNPAFIKCMPGKATINSTMMLVRVSEKDKLDSKFVYHILNSNIFRKLIHLKVSGSSIPHLFQADMKEFTFSVPSDIRTQKKISHIFDIIDKEIDLAYKKLDLLKLQKQGFMQQMFI